MRLGGLRRRRNRSGYLVPSWNYIDSHGAGISGVRHSNVFTERERVNSKLRSSLAAGLKRLLTMYAKPLAPGGR